MALLQYLSDKKARDKIPALTCIINKSVLSELGLVIKNEKYLPQFSHALIRDYFLSRYIRKNLDEGTAAPWLRPNISIFDFPVFYFLKAQAEKNESLQKCIPFETDEITRTILTTNEQAGINFVCTIYNYNGTIFQSLLEHIFANHKEIIDTICPAVIKFILKYGAHLRKVKYYRLTCLQQHHDSEVRSLVCECIGVAHDREQFNYLVSEIELHNTPVALWSIRKLRAPNQISQYIVYFSSPRNDLVISAIKAMATMDLPTDALELIRLKDVPDSAQYFKNLIMQFPSLSNNICQMLGTLVIDNSFISIPLDSWENERELLCIIELISEVREPRYLPFLKSQYVLASNEYLRNSIIDAVGEIRSISSAEWLIAIHADESSELVRGNILWALGNNPTIVALAFLRRIANTKCGTLGADEKKWLGWALSQHSFSINSHMHVYP